METQFGKFIRLFGNIFFSAIGFILFIVLLLLGLRLVLGAIDYIPWISFVYMSFMLLIPATLFVTVFVIFYKRTKIHPVKSIRWLSNIIFTLAISSWIIILVNDGITFYKNGYPDIDKYFSFNLLFLVINVGLIFFTGVIQALGNTKEKDWMEKHVG